MARPRLIERLNAGLRSGCKLTLLSAPAGYGKTTLLSEWVASAGRAVAWVSLDKSDNDPARFWAYVVAALQTAQVGIGQAALATLGSSQPQAIKPLLMNLMNEIAVLPEHLILVLEDYHAIQSPAIHKALAFLLDHLPPQLHLVIASRADPPLPIALFRGRGQVTELRQSDLHFTLDEATVFLSRVAGLDLAVDEIAALTARTEGWIAGLQMAAISMRGQHDVTGFIHAFTGSDRHILDYVAEEVLLRQPEHIQRFLLQTSILERLTGALCDAILGGETEETESFLIPAPPVCLFPDSSGQAILEYLDHNNLFILPLDNERRWYRYHRLFADLLRHRLERLRPNLVPTLHRRASEWFEENGLNAEAIEHALAAQDPERATHLVEQVAESTMLRSEFATLLRWVEALPQDQVRDRPRLCIYHALAWVLGGHPVDDAQARLQAVVEADVDHVVAGEVATFRALIAAYRGDREHSAELAQQALALLPQDSLFFRSFVAGFMGLTYLYSGDIEPATRAFREAIRVSQETGNLVVSVLARCHLAELSMLKGQLDESNALYEQALDVAVGEQGKWQPVAGVALVGLGRVALERYDLEAATRYLTEGIELAQNWGEAGAIGGYVDLARARQAQGDELGALEAIETAQRLAERFDAMALSDIHAALYQTRLWIAQGNMEAAERWVEERGLVQDLSLETLKDEIRHTPARLFRFVEYTTLAQLRIAQGYPEDALSVLRTLFRMAEDTGWEAYCIAVLVLKSLAFQAQGDIEQALGALGQALSLAEPGGIVHVFVEKGPAMARLLDQAVAQGIAPRYAGRLLASFPASESPAPFQETSAERAAKIEPLSEREHEVLRCLTTHLSSPEIARELFVSVNTVRFHIKNIYSKLGVHSRADAVQRAKEQRLL